MKTLYPNGSILTKLVTYLQPFFAGFGKRTTRQLIWIVIAMLAVGAVHSVRSLHTEFLSNLDLASLNSMYYALGYAKRPVRRMFARCLVQLARQAVPDHLRSSPCFLIIDDTLVPKFGRKFDHVGILFDHAAHDGQNYKNGHCFVCIVLSVPVAVSSTTKQMRYLSIPLLLRLWEKGGPSKLQIAHDLPLELRDTLNSEETTFCWLTPGIRKPHCSRSCLSGRSCGSSVQFDWILPCSICRRSERDSGDAPANAARSLPWQISP